MALHLAAHSDSDAYWQGGDYELNITFDTLRDKQWQNVIQALWRLDTLAGPFAGRYIPGSDPQVAAIQVPQPTAAQTQYGALVVDALWVGCRLLVTRSLFECITLQVPLGMFDPPPVKSNRIPALEQVYQDIALAVYERAPFDIANMGFQCECKLLAELLANPRQKADFLAAGHFFARDAVLITLGVDPTAYPESRPDLRWIPG